MKKFSLSLVLGFIVNNAVAIIPPKPMLISGILDTSATVATGIVIAHFYRNE